MNEGSALSRESTWRPAPHLNTVLPSLMAVIDEAGSGYFEPEYVIKVSTVII